jgi:YVTN family beta-propeller protein
MILGTSMVAAAAPFAFVTVAKPGDGTIQTINGSLVVVDVATRKSVGATIAVEPLPAAVVAAQTNDRVYVLNQHNFGNGTISVIAVATAAVIATIPVGDTPTAMAIGPDERTAYVLNTRAASVSVVDLAQNLVTREIALGGLAKAIAVSPDGRKVYVPNGSHINEIDAGTLEVRSLLAYGNAANALPSPDGRLLYVVNTDPGGGAFGELIYPGNTVSVFDLETQQVLKRIQVGASPFVMAFSPDGKFVYVANAVDATISVIDTSIRQEVRRFPATARSMAVSSDGNKLLATDRNHNLLQIYDAANLAFSSMSVPFEGVIPGAIAVRDKLSPGANGMIAKFEWISGDRQIAVDTRVPPKPYVVRALDAEGNPISGAALFIGSAGDPGQAYLQDEFHFRGFNTLSTICYSCFGSVAPEFTAITDANGVGRAQGAYADGPPSAFAVGVRQMGVTSGVRAFASAIVLKHQPAGTPAVVVEYFNSAVGHYFNTIDQAEIDALDAGKFANWHRSPGAFVAYANRPDAPVETVPVCRFFSSVFTSHFYTADTDECNNVIARWSDVWTLETREAFWVYLPDRISGSCGSGQQPIHRMYNNRPVPNHRYITDKSLRDRMTGAGWRAEGYGPEAVMFCVPG